MRRPIAALLSSLVILIGQSAGATNCYVYNKFEALCQFNTLELCSHRTLFSPDPAYADAGRDRSTDEIALRSHCTSIARRQARSNTRQPDLHNGRKNVTKINLGEARRLPDVHYDKIGLPRWRCLFAAVTSAPAQDLGTLNPRPLPPLANPDSPKTMAKELFARKATPPVPEYQ